MLLVPTEAPERLLSPTTFQQGIFHTAISFNSFYFLVFALFSLFSNGVSRACCAGIATSSSYLCLSPICGLYGAERVMDDEGTGTIGKQRSLSFYVGTTGGWKGRLISLPAFL
jgi:hypothetical protein